MFRIIPLEEIADINPRLDRSTLPPPDTPVSFVPMAAVDEVNGKIEAPERRHLRDVLKGFTVFREGDVLFAKITPCMQNGKSAIAKNLLNGLGFGSTEFHVLRPRQVVLPEWLRYFVRQPHFRREAQRNFTGTGGQQRVPVEFMRKAEIPLPTLDDQRRIVDILSRAEGIVRLRRRASKITDELTPALFFAAFGDPESNPKRWPTLRLQDIADIQGGLQVSQARADNPIEVPYLRVANVYRDQVALSEIKMLRVTAAELDRTRLERGDILVVEGHGNPHEVGRAAVWGREIDCCTHQNHLIRVRVDRGRMFPEYLSRLLNSVSGRRQLLRAGKTTSGLNTISVSNVGRVVVPVPPIQEQSRFVDNAKAVQSVGMQSASGLARAEEFFQSVLHRAFRGEI